MSGASDIFIFFDSINPILGVILNRNNPKYGENILSKGCCCMVIYQSVSQFSRSVISDSLWSHEAQHSRPPCPSPTPGLYPDSCPLSQWCHLTISSSVVPFSCLQSFQTSGSFLMSQLFTSGGQNIGVSASTSVLPMNTQDWFPLRYTVWMSLTRQTFVDKVMPLLFNMLSRLAITYWLVIYNSKNIWDGTIINCMHIAKLYNFIFLIK